MNGTKLLTAALAALVLVGGLAAVGAATPADVSNASENADTADDRADAVGPADGLPEQVSAQVNDSHDTIESFLDGSIESLGESLRDLRSDDGTAESSGSETGGNDATQND